MKIIRGDRNNLEIEAGNIINEEIRHLLKSKDTVIIGVVGGKSVTGIYKMICDNYMDWSRIKVFLVDERVSEKKDELNYSIVKDYFPSESLFGFDVYNKDVERGLSLYENKLIKFGGKFDIIILSSGEDGHVGALFPNHETIHNHHEYFIYTEKSPKPPPFRMSASKSLLLKSGFAVIVFFGSSKKNAFEKFQEDGSVESLPCRVVKDIKESYIFVDF